MADEKKIFVDDDWKREAQAEKERLAEQEKQAPPPGAAGGLPEADFLTLVSSFLTQALLAMGLLETPSGQVRVNLDLAKFNIDMLEMLEQKTKGNLTDEEQQMLNQALHQVRMAYVEVATRQGPIG